MATILLCARFSISITLIVIFHFIALGQYATENFIRYTSRDGLSDNMVLDIQQDSLGFLWIGTENGLNRFDGYAFKNYFFDSPPGFLASSLIRKIKLFNQHELGIVSNGGFQVLDPLSMQLRNFIVPDTTPFSAIRNAASDAVRLRNGHYAVVTASGFFEFNPDGTLAFRYDAYDLKDYGMQGIRYGRQIFNLEEDVLVYHESRGLAHYRPSEKNYTIVDSSFENWIPFIHPAVGDAIHWITKSQVGPHEFIFLSALDSFIYYNAQTHRRVSSPLPIHWANSFAWNSRILSINDSLLAISGAYNGFYFLHFNRATGKIKFDNNKILPGYRVLCLFQDREDRLWVGTRAGLLMQVISKPLIEKLEWPGAVSKSNGFRDALVHNNILYASRQDPESGLIAVDMDSMKITKEFNFYEKAKWNIITSIEMYYPDTIWLGSGGGLIWLDTGNGNYGKVNEPRLEGDTIGFNMVLPVDANGDAWMLLQLRGHLGKYNLSDRTFKSYHANSKPPLPFEAVKHVVYDSYGDIWLGGHSLARLNRKSMQFDTVMQGYAGVHKYNEDILTMVADDAGSLWIHNAENGLLQYRIKEKEFRQFTMKDGLPSNTIIAISPVIEGILFMVTPHHLVRMDTKNYGIEIFGNESDLPEEITDARSMYWDEQNKLMYAYYRYGLIRFPLERPASSSEGNDIILQELEINNEQKLYYPENDIKLKAGENNLIISYAVIDFEQSHDYQFAYNFNDTKEWINVGSQRIIHLTNLSPGAHHLQIRATGKSGRQKVSHFYFNIRQPFWKQAWFIPLIAVCVSVLIYLIFRIREARIMEKANLDNQIAVAEMKALHAQMNPHFIFNSLNSIKEMVLQNDVKEASRYLSDFAFLIRMTLDQSRQTFVSLRSTMEYLSWYVKMEQLRNQNFHFEMEAQELLDPDETLIPPMLIQPFIENAIWHGVDGKKNKIDIKVLFEKEDDQLICTIEDNGIGIEKSLEKKNGTHSKHQSVGINNIQKRIDLLNQKHHFKSRIQISDKHANGNGHASGTIVRITLPLEIQEQK